MKIERDVENSATAVSQDHSALPSTAPEPSLPRRIIEKWPVAVVVLGFITTLVWCGWLAFGLIWLIFW
jgi:hypothetical protein